MPKIDRYVIILGMSIPFIIVLVIVLIGGFWFISLYNKFIKFMTRAGEAWSDIDVQLKRRYDLIPNLINTVRGYAVHESGTLEAVVTARNNAINAIDDHAPIEDRAKKENDLSSTLKSIFALTENYPDLKANQNFLELQKELSDTENKIQSARRFYNGNVRDLNILVDTFPSNIIASMFKFAKKAFFDLGEEKEVVSKPVEVKF